MRSLIDLPLGDFRFSIAEDSDIIEVGRREAMEKLPAFMSLTNEPKGAGAPSDGVVATG